MNFHPALLEHLAAGYVLGTLRGPARRRFRAVLGGNLAARRAVAQWEKRLAPLVLEIAPLSPPAEVWNRVLQRLNLKGAPASAALIQRTGFWQAMAAAMAAIAIGLGAYVVTHLPAVQLVQSPLKRSEPGYVAVFASAQMKPVWMLHADLKAGELRAMAMTVPPLAADKSYALWMLPKDGSAPIPMGLLPSSGEMRMPLNAHALAVLANTGAVAVSLEPAGGSPTGAPTGPVMYTAPLVREPTAAA